MDRILYLAAPQKRYWIRNTGEMQGVLSYKVLLLGTNNGPRTSLTILLSSVKDVYIFTSVVDPKLFIPDPDPFPVPDPDPT